MSRIYSKPFIVPELKGLSVAVIGACGFIGSHLVDSLLSNGCRVLAFSRSIPGLISKKSLQNPLLSLCEVDISNLTQLERKIANVDILIHLASSSIPSTSNLDPYSDVTSNLLGSLNVLNAALENQIKKFIFISSGGTVYGLPSQIPILENHPTNPSCSYGIIKLAIEKYISLYRDLYGLQAISLRLANPYGERQRINAIQGVIPVFMSRALRSEPIEVWGDGTVVRDFVYISDVIDAIRLSCTYCGDYDVFNIGSGSGLSLNELIRLIEQVTKKTIDVHYKSSRKYDVPTNVLSIERANSHLSWSPSVSPREGITRLYNYLLTL